MSNLKCPRCGSQDTHSGDLLYHCDGCGEMEERYTTVPNKPILESCGFKPRGNPRGQWRVTVWRHSTEPDRYSYSVAIAGGVMAAPGGGTRHGCVCTAADALASLLCRIIGLELLAPCDLCQ